MFQDWKGYQFMNYENDNEKKTLMYIGTGFIKFSTLQPR